MMMRIAKLYDGDPVNSAKTTELYQEAIPNSRLMARTAWEEAADLADKHNVPGKFTAMIGWEWSPIPVRGNPVDPQTKYSLAVGLPLCHKN